MWLPLNINLAAMLTPIRCHVQLCAINHEAVYSAADCGITSSFCRSGGQIASKKMSLALYDSGCCNSAILLWYISFLQRWQKSMASYTKQGTDKSGNFNRARPAVLAHWGVISHLYCLSHCYLIMGHPHSRSYYRKHRSLDTIWLNSSI